MADNSEEIRYYYDDPKQKNLEKEMANFQVKSDVSLFDEINMFTFSLNDHASEEEGIPRLCQAIVRLNSRNQLDLQKYQILFDRFEFQIEKDEEYIKSIFERLFHLVKPFVKPWAYSIEKNWLRQRNVCFVMAIMIGKYGKYGLEYFTRYLDYLLKITENILSNHKKIIENLLKEAALYAVICIDNLALLNCHNEQINLKSKMNLEVKILWNNKIKNVYRMFALDKNNKNAKDKHNYFCEISPVNEYQINKNLINKIHKKLEKLSQFISNETVYSSKFDLILYQIGFFAKWCHDNVFSKNKLNPFFVESRIIKMSEFSARNFKIDEYLFAPVQCAFEVTSGVYYYEIVLITSGSFRIGWATNFTLLTEEPKKCIGEDKFSIGFDGNEGCIWHVREQKLENVSPWKSLDVIGCLIDVNQQKFAFYHNGKEIQFDSENVYFSSLPYYAIATLPPHQQCFFNFGQKPFKYRPTEIESNNFHISSNGDAQKYRLMGFHMDYISNNRYLRYVIYDEFSLKNIPSRSEIQNNVDQFVREIFERNSNKEKIITFFDEYYDFINRQGPSLLSQSLSNSNRKQNNYLEHIHQLIEIFCNSSKEKIYEFFSLVIDSSDIDEMLLAENTTNDHIRQFCHLIILSVDLQGIRIHVFDQLNYDFLIELLLNQIGQCKDFDLILLEILSLELLMRTILNQNKLISPLIFTRIAFTFAKHETLLDEIDVNQLIHSIDSDKFLKYQIGFSSKWELENLQSESKIAKSIELPFKLFKIDEFDVRNDFDKILIQSSSATIQSDQIYYYEVTLITGGSMTFGWATRELGTIVDKRRLFCDYFWIGINQFCQRNMDYTFDSEFEKSCWKRGDVIGCLINLKIKKFVFYINGQEIEYDGDDHFSDQPYFACAYIEAHQQCWFNFGQEPFVHLPKENENICELKDQDGKHTILLEPNYFLFPIINKEDIWFKRNLENIIFRDETQTQFDQFIIDLENKVADCNYCCGDCEQLFQHFIKLMKTDTQKHLRLIQAIIQNLGKICLQNGSENLVPHELFAIVEHLKSIDSTMLLGRIPISRQFLELFYPYLQLNYDDQMENSTQLRNICITLSMYSVMNAASEEFNKVLYHEAKQFLMNVIEKSLDNLTLLYAIICLEQFSTIDSNRKDIVQHDWRRLSELSDYVNLMTCENLYESNAYYIKYQVGFCSSWFNEKILSIKNQKFDTEEMNPVTLDPRSATEHLKLSPDLLSTRSDFEKQSVFCNFPISTGVYYYETILLTSGVMWIGWDTKNDNKIMSSGKKSNLIAMNGYIKVISDCGISEPFESEFNSWKFGDVVGCLIDCQKHKFAFYLNGKQIYCKENDEDFSNDSYFAFATLSNSQHCYFNFGQSKFKFSPNLLFKDFHGNAYNDNICQLCNKKPALGRARTDCCQLKACIECLNEPICSNCQTV